MWYFLRCYYTFVKGGLMVICLGTISSGQGLLPDSKLRNHFGDEQGTIWDCQGPNLEWLHARQTKGLLLSSHTQISRSLGALHEVLRRFVHPAIFGEAKSAVIQTWISICRNCTICTIPLYYPLDPSQILLNEYSRKEN